MPWKSTPEPPPSHMWGSRVYRRFRYDAPMSHYRFILVILLPWIPVANGEDRPTYTEDVRPILSNTCFKCHGPDGNAREAGLRLDLAETATLELKSGARAIVPGDPEASAILTHVTSTDPNVMMPPPSVGVRLNDREVSILRDWIADGAEYETHWSFQRVDRPALPNVANPSWPRNGIDHFVAARLDAEGLTPAPEADRYMLVRRLYLDLTGLPPTIEEADAFVNDTSTVAYEQLVDHLLDTPQYGERFAGMWLDLARYADSKGYEADRLRTIWRYRDWVIDAFNRDVSYDQFTEEQLAGDLLPNPSTEQLIATAFHRNTMTNDEGGTSDEEFRSAAVVDRVNTTFEVWMGMTMACAQCHTHKYDPITQKEYYQLYDFYNHTADRDLMDESPTIPSPTKEQARKLDLIAAEHDREQKALEGLAESMIDERAAWEKTMTARAERSFVLGPWHTAAAIEGDDGRVLHDTVLPFEVTAKPLTEGEGAYFSVNASVEDGKPFTLPTSNAAYGFYRTIETKRAMDLSVLLGSDDSIKVWVNGEVIHDNFVNRGLKANDDKVKLPLKAGQNDIVIKVVNMAGGGAFQFRTVKAPLDPALVAALSTAKDARSDEERALILRTFTEEAEALKPVRERLAAITAERDALQKTIPTTPIFQELGGEDRRETHIHERGSYLNLGEAVSADVPEAFHEWDDAWPRNRLGLAKWLTSRENPLTARVAANRYWEQFFGEGLVSTSEDFGVQGDLPSHPELLDWLAVEFMENDWSMKQLCRTIVTSATYRQASSTNQALVERDPYNRLLSRGPRIRLSAESIRDQALSVSGLLSSKMFGPSVMPYQPEGVWQVVYNGDPWKTSEGEDQYRRGLYTTWRRTAPYPSMIAFDAPSREFCELSRTRTNTPLQALVTLNDPVYIEAAQALARRALTTPAASDSERVTYAFRRVLIRPPHGDELEALLHLLADAREEYGADADAATKFASEPIGPVPADMDVVEAAAYTVVGNVLLNLDETVMKL